MIHCNQVNNPNDDRSFPIGTIQSLPIILTTSIVVFAVDAAINRFRRGSYQPAPPQLLPHETVASPPPCQSLTRFVDKTRSILADIQAIEKQLSIEKDRRRLHLSLEYQATTETKQIKMHSHRRSNTEPSCAFSAFCDRLLLTNKIWKQERELKELRTTVKAKARTQKDVAFQTFCDQLLLWNKIWRLERKVVALGQEKGRIERERVAAITRAAERMVQGVQKERMVEELVEELIDEVEMAKAEVVTIRAERERELAEVNGQWLKDYKQVTRELAQLKLAQESRLVEQEVSNGMEESLIESLHEGQRRIKVLEEKIEEYALADEVTLNGAEGVPCGVSDIEGGITDNEFDSISELSSSSTCVSLRGITHSPPSIVTGDTEKRRRCVSQGSPIRSVSTKPWNFSTSIGESFHFKARSAVAAESLSTRIWNDSGRPLAVRDRTMSVLVRSPTSPAGSGIKSGGLANRAPWRV